MNKLNKTFYSGNILTAAELNLLTSKIDEIVNSLPTSSTQNPGITETEVNNKINAAKNELQLKINQILSQIENLDDGNTHVRTDEEMMDLFKQAGKEVLVYYGVCDENGHPFFNTIIDENGVKPAAIIGAITDNNGKLNSNIGISADQITLDGQVLAEAITAKSVQAANAAVSNLNVNNGIEFSNQKLEITSSVDSPIAEIYMDVSGNSDRGNITVKLSNDEGLQLNCEESSTGEIGSFNVGKSGNRKFAIFTSTGTDVQRQSGYGYTGVINGAKFINGICVGAV